MKPHKRILAAILILAFSATSISCNVPINFNQSYNLAPNTQLTSPRLQTSFANLVSGKRINPHVAAILTAVLIGISGYPMAAVTVALLWFGGYILYQLTDKPSEHQAAEPEYNAMIYYLRHETKEDALKFIQTVEPHIKRAHAKGKRIVVVLEQGGLLYTADFDQLLRTDYVQARDKFEREKKRIHELVNNLLKDVGRPIPEDILANEFISTIITSLRRLSSEGIPIRPELEDPELNEWVYRETERFDSRRRAFISFFEGMTTEAIRRTKNELLISRLNCQARDKQFIKQFQGLLSEEGVFVVTFRGMAHNVPIIEMAIPGLAIYANREEALSWLKEEVLNAEFGVSEYDAKKLLGIPMTEEEEKQLLLCSILENALRHMLQQEGSAPTDTAANMLLKKILHSTNMSYNDLLELSSYLALNPQLLRNPSSPHDQPLAIYNWMRAKGKITDDEAQRYFPAAERMRFFFQQPIKQRATGSNCEAMIYYLTHESREDALRLIRTIEEPIKNASAMGRRVVILFEFAGPFPPSHVPQLLSMGQTKAHETFEQATKEILQQCKSFIESPEHPSAFSETNDFNTTFLLFLKTLRHNGIVVDIEFEEADFNDLVSVYRANELVNEAEINFFRGKVGEAIQKIEEELAALHAILQARDRKVTQRLQGLLDEGDVFVIAFRGALHNIHAELPKESSFLKQVHAAVDEPTLKTAVGAAEYALKRKLGIAITADEKRRLLLSNVVINTLLRLLYSSLSHVPEGMQIPPDAARVALKNILHPTNVSYQDLENLSAHLATNPRLANSSTAEQTMAIYNWMRANGKITDAQAMQYFRAAEQTRQQRNPPDRHRHGGSTITLPLIFLTLGLGATPAVTPVLITADREISRSL